MRAPSGRSRALAALALALSAALACSVNVPPPAPPGGVPPSAEGARAAWARVLSTRVDAAGRIDFAGLSRDRSDLDACVAWFGQVPPAFPSKSQALAHAINAYNATAMYGILQWGVPKTLLDSQVRFFYSNRFRIAGKTQSLTDYERDVVAPQGDPRVHFALNRMVLGSPKLPREPFDGGRLDAQLDAAAREFLNDPRQVQVYAPDRVVRVSMMLDWYRAEFLTQAPSLAAYLDRYRPEIVPPGYELEFLVFDWTVARQ